MQNTKSWMSVVFSAAIIGTFVRIVFFILLAPKNLLVFSSQTPYVEILKAFFLGFRFDLSAICHMTLLFWLISLILNKKYSLWIWKILLITWSFLLIVDVGYYSFYNDRFNVLVFGIIEDDTWALIKTFWKNYPVIWIFVVTFFFGLFIHRKINQNFYLQNKNSKRISGFGTRLLTLILLICGARGTFGLFPLGDHDTVVSSVPFLNTLSYGTAHSLSRAFKLKREQIQMGSSKWDANIQEFGYLGREDDAFQDYFQKKITPGTNRYNLMESKTTLPVKPTQKPNVVLVVMESWGNYGLQFQSPQFDLVGGMKRYFKEDLVNFQFLSTTPATTGSLSCILSGLPQRAISPFLTESDYLQTGLSTSPAKTYHQNGYTTRFVYGGNPGWRDMNKFALAQGFDSVEGEVDIEKKLAEKNLKLVGHHDWGVYDEDVFRYVQMILQLSQTPQFIVVMTTTNHPPFELPAKTEKINLRVDDFPEKQALIDTDLALKRFLTFRYSSDALALFLTSLGNDSPLREKTIIAATADHTFWIKNFSQEEIFMKSAVPFFISLPQNIKLQLTEVQKENFKNSFGGHQDIWPTLYDISLPMTNYESFGRSLWTNPQTSFAASYDRLIFNPSRGVLVTNATQFSSLQSADGLRYKPDANKTDLDQQLAQKYRALMAALDSYLHHSKMTP